MDATTDADRATSASSTTRSRANASRKPKAGHETESKPINLALQGGGAHGAFTWGVLDRLLEDERISFGWISGTSAGAVNAVALASGLAAGGDWKQRQAEARAVLQRVWKAVESAGVSDLARISPFLYGL